MSKFAVTKVCQEVIISGLFVPEPHPGLAGIENFVYRVTWHFVRQIVSFNVREVSLLIQGIENKVANTRVFYDPVANDVASAHLHAIYNIFDFRHDDAWRVSNVGRGICHYSEPTN